VVTPVTQTQKTKAQAEADLASFDIRNILAGTEDPNKPKQTTSSSRAVTRLNKISAKALLEKTAKDIQYNVKFTDVDLDDFLKKFKAEQDRQIENVVKSTTVKPGASTDEIKRQVENTLTTEYPSYFKPEIFASDYIWAKVNFKDEKTLGGKSLTALNNVRSILAGFGPLDFSDAELYNAAKQIAKGEITNDDFRSTIAQKAALNYPQYAERLKQNPGSTIRDLASPYINLMAKELELDPNAIQLDNMDLDRALRPDGTAGKIPSVSLADFRIKLRNSPQWENTTAANESARTAATALGRAFGYGV
jgi:hypothetical protein